MTKRARILFVTWDGPGLSYLESLFLPIFTELGVQGWSVDVLQFRWGPPEERQRIAAACAAAGIGYRSVAIRRTPRTLGPLASAALGGIHIRRAIRAFGSDIVMPRSTMPAMAVLAGGIAALLPVLFDADGLEIDERAESGGLAPTGAGYRLLRDVEAQVARRSAAVLTRTDQGRRIILARAGPALDPARVVVVANGRDPDVFKPFDSLARIETRRMLGIDPDAPLLVYIGSTGHKYDTPAIGALISELARRRPDARLLVLTGDPAKAAAELNLTGHPAVMNTTQIRSVLPSEAARFLAAADVGTAFIRTSFSMQGASPIKVGEYLLCGTPVVGNAIIGNNAEAVAADVYRDEPTDMPAAAAWIENRVLADRDGMRHRARLVGLQSYSLARSVADYATALNRVTL